MNAIEFQTTITNSFVQIPNYEEFENKQVKIIIIDNTVSPIDNTHKNNFIHKQTKNPSDMPDNLDFLSRNEANER